ncbi:MAG TPA: hypothetical protein EYN67_16955 [Flavobacteriales bacterium]|nr:hypothetical protein [Methylococcaceae bacterium]HHZ97189.1 hypothetical protein [Flavobacteriales bacterium]
MKTLILAVLALSLSACSTVSFVTPGVTPQAFNKGVKTCDGKGGVKMVTQTIGVDYDVFCMNGDKHQL